MIALRPGYPLYVGAGTALVEVWDDDELIAKIYSGVERKVRIVSKYGTTAAASDDPTILEVHFGRDAL